MKITEDTVPFPGIPQHYWGLMSDGDELPDFSTNYADAFFGVNAGPASGGGGRAFLSPAPIPPALDQQYVNVARPWPQCKNLDNNANSMNRHLVVVRRKLQSTLHSMYRPHSPDVCMLPCPVPSVRILITLRIT